jgi:hypothetical protein
MGCFVFLFALISPRLALIVVWLASDLLTRAFEHWYLPFIGFFILPWTTLVYALCWSSGDKVAGFEIFLVAFAFCVDVAAWFGGGRRAASR